MSDGGASSLASPAGGSSLTSASTGRNSLASSRQRSRSGSRSRSRHESESQDRKGWPPWATLAVALLVLIVIATVLEGARARAADVRLRSACARGAESETIFVALVCGGRPASAAAALHALFERAACPFRVFVGLYEAYASSSGAASGAPAPPPATSETVKRYAALAARHSELRASFTDHIRVVAADAASGGPYAARYALLDAAYRGEAYVMTLPADVEVALGWDAALLGGLAAARAAGATQCPFLVAPPAPPPAAAHHVEAAWAFPHGAYLAVADFAPETRLPTLSAVPFLHAAPSPQPCSWWSAAAVTFAPAAAWLSETLRDTDSVAGRPMRRFAFAQHLVEGAEDALITAAAEDAGWALLAPTLPLTRAMQAGDVGLWTSLAAAPTAAFLASATRGAAAASCSLLGMPPYVGALARRGVVLTAPPSPEQAERAVAAALGVAVDGPLPLEAVCKFGSMSAYTHARAHRLHAIVQAVTREARRRRRAASTH